MNKEEIKKLKHLKAEIANIYLQSGKYKSVMVTLGNDGYFYVENKKTPYKIGKNYEIEKEMITIVPNKKR